MERGSRDTFIVYTTPIAASVTTDLAIAKDEDDIDLGGEDTYFGCSPTPCSIDMPRKIGFSVLITKDGYLPQTFTVDSLTYKELTKRNKNAVIGTSLASGAVVGSSIMTIDAILAGATGVTTGAATTALAATMLPVAVVGTMALSVDAGSGANLDFYPNPISTKLIKQETSQDGISTEQFIEVFDNYRRTQTPYQQSKKHRSK